MTTIGGSDTRPEKVQRREAEEAQERMQIREAPPNTTVIGDWPASFDHPLLNARGSRTILQSTIWLYGTPFPLFLNGYESPEIIAEREAERRALMRGFLAQTSKSSAVMLCADQLLADVLGLGAVKQAVTGLQDGAQRRQIRDSMGLPAGVPAGLQRFGFDRRDGSQPRDMAVSLEDYGAKPEGDNLPFYQRHARQAWGLLATSLTTVSRRAAAGRPHAEFEISLAACRDATTALGELTKFMHPDEVGHVRGAAPSAAREDNLRGRLLCRAIELENRAAVLDVEEQVDDAAQARQVAALMREAVAVLQARPGDPKP